MDLKNWQLKSDRCLLLLIDFQEKLATAMPEEKLNKAVANVRILCKAAELLNFPIMITEQYPKGLGTTLPEIAEAAGDARRVEKIHFAATDVEEFVEALRLTGRDQILVAGMETHVCVFQTVRGLLRLGCHPFIVGDAVVSRRKDNFSIGLSMCQGAGAALVSTESSVFDLLNVAQGDAFKTLSKLIR